MPYPPALVAPMREELVRLGVEELYTAEEVDALFQNMGAEETALLVVNSVCGCAAANARPAVAMSKQGPIQPDRMTTVFAGQDLEATARAREHLVGIPPSSPFMALLKGGDPVYVIERRHIEGRSANAIAMDLVQAYNKYCGPSGVAAGEIETPQAAQPQRAGFPANFRSIM